MRAIRSSGIPALAWRLRKCTMRKPPKPEIHLYNIGSDSAWQLAQEKGYKTAQNGTRRFVYCTKEQWLELDTFHVWLQKQYGPKQ